MEEQKIEYKGIKFDVSYYYQPYEAEVRYYLDGSGYPGCPESFEIDTITFKGEDFTELLEDNLEEIEELLREKNNEY